MGGSCQELLAIGRTLVLAIKSSCYPSIFSVGGWTRSITAYLTIQTWFGIDRPRAVLSSETSRSPLASLVLSTTPFGGRLP